MKSAAKDVKTYIAEAPEEKRAVLTALWRLHRKAYPQATECIDYGMPCYKDGEHLVGAFASQKNYIALYGMGGVMDAFAARLKGASCGKGCVRFKSAAAVDLGLVEEMVTAAAKKKAA